MNTIHGTSLNKDRQPVTANVVEGPHGGELVTHDTGLQARIDETNRKLDILIHLMYQLVDSHGVEIHDHVVADQLRLLDRERLVVQ